MATKRLTPAHPGAILREEFIEAWGLTAYKVAKAIHMFLYPVSTTSCLRSVESRPRWHLRLAAYFGTDRTVLDQLAGPTMSVAIAKAKIEKALKEIEPLRAA